MHTNQKGFTAVEGMLVLLVIGILSFTGWFVWNAQQNANKVDEDTIVVDLGEPKKTNRTTCQLTDAYKGTIVTPRSNGFEFCLPNGWELGSALEVESNNDGTKREWVRSLDLTYDESKEGRIIAISDVDKPVEFTMFFNEYGNDSLATFSEVGPITARNISGFEYTKTYSTTDENLGILKGAKQTSFHFTNDIDTIKITSTQFDGSKDISALTREIAKSVKFK